MSIDLLTALMGWAVLLSGLPAPAALPRVVQVEHQWLVATACQGRECRVLGLTLALGPTVALDRVLEPQNDIYAAGIAVHELVHVLQYANLPKWADCADLIAWERQAYQAQRDYLLAYGVPTAAGVSMHMVGCD